MNPPKKTVGIPARQEEYHKENTELPKERILIVDDDRSVREMLSRVLVEEGYRVLSAADGAEALEISAATQALQRTRSASITSWSSSVRVGPTDTPTPAPVSSTSST